MSEADQKHTQWRHAAQWFGKADDDIAMAELALGPDAAVDRAGGASLSAGCGEVDESTAVAASIKVRR